MARSRRHPSLSGFDRADAQTPHFDTLEPRLLLSAGDPPYIDAMFGAGPDPAQEAQTVYGSGNLWEATDVDTTVGVDWGNGVTDVTTVPAGQTGFSFTYAYPDDTPTGTASDTYWVEFTTSNVYGSSSAGTELTVENVTPTITSMSTDAVTINEGDMVTLSGTFTDPSALDSFDLYVDWNYMVDSDSQNVLLPAGSHSFSPTHTYADEGQLGVYSIMADLHDDDGGDCEIKYWSVTVNDVTPAITSASVAESVVDYKTPVQLSASFEDPGVLDEHFVRIIWGDGSVDTTFVPTIGQRSFTESHSYAAPASASQAYPIQVIVQGYDNADQQYVSDSRTTRVIVENHDPQITSLSLSAAAIDENGSTTLSGTFTDFTPNDTHSVQIDWGDGSAAQTVDLAADARLFSVAHTYLDDNPTGTPSDVNTISVAVIDADGNQDSGALDVTVSNIAPQLTSLSVDPATIDENGTVTLTGAFTDPGTLDVHTVDVDWGDGSDVEALTVAAGERTFSGSHQYLDDDPTGTPSDAYTISVTVTDDDTGTDDNAIDVTVNNVAPSDSELVLDPAIIDENGVTTLMGSFTDPGTLDTYTVAIVWGDGSAVETLTLAAGERSFSVMHQYLDDDPTATPQDDYTIDVTVTDDDTGEQISATVITVMNVDPVVVDFATSAPGVGDADEGETITVSGSFTDVGTLDTHTAVIDWGDGATSDATVTESGGSGTFAAEHAYEFGGIYTVTVTVTDDDTGADTAVAYAVISGVGVHDGVLQAIGTDANDRVKINQTGNGTMKVHASFLSDRGKKRTFDVEGIEKIQILLGDGNDRAQISGNIDLLAIIDAGAGNDHLKAGRGPTVMMGAEGNDMLIGGKGNDLLIGGPGKDRLVGGPGDDILIGARTVFDLDDDAVVADFDVPVLALLSEWGSERDYDMRVANISGLGDGPRLNGDYFLDETTVLGGEVGDKMTGASGENWYVDIMSKNGKQKGTAAREDLPPAAASKGNKPSDIPANPEVPADPDAANDPATPPGHWDTPGKGRAKHNK